MSGNKYLLRYESFCFDTNVLYAQPHYELTDVGYYMNDISTTIRALNTEKNRTRKKKKKMNLNRKTTYITEVEG